MVHQASDFVIDIDLLRRFDVSGPRYTSYPTADRFVEAFNGDQYAHWLAHRQVGGFVRPLSVYVHLPFCESLCWYCACNKIITKDHGRSARYVTSLGHEMELVSRLQNGDRSIRQLHWGGGTPTFLSHAEMRALMQHITEHFPLARDGEFSIEIDPRHAGEETIALLAELGFNRLSMGVQDFDPAVQRAVHRVQPAELTLNALDQARRHGFHSVNMDLIYGLPLQTAARFERTLDQVIAAGPDRIALYNYAHLPSVFKPQRRICADDLPGADERLAIMTLAIRRFCDAGYVYIGMDHFARPDDELAVAQRQGRLYRNFQGYSANADGDLLGFGVSAIGKVGPVYVQNTRVLADYYDRLERGELPVLRGLELSADDLVRRTVIHSLMCNFAVSFQAVEIAHLIDFRQYFAHELEELKPFANAGLVDVYDDWINVTPRGRLLVRPLAMVFDRHLRASRLRAQYSKVI